MYFVINHPLILDKLTKMRDKNNPSLTFRNCLFELTQLLAYEATKDLKLKRVEIETPITKCLGYKLESEIVIVPILRAGLGMADAVLNLIPNASTGFLGLYRNEETLETVKYYEKLPNNIKGADVILCDPMIATSNSIITGIQYLEKYEPKSITVIGLVAAPEGLKKLEEKYPNIPVYLAAVDEKLNENGYIVPGLGDAGDRIFKSK